MRDRFREFGLDAELVRYDVFLNHPRSVSLPIAYREAEKLLRGLGGPRVPDDWQGGLPFSYHVGPGGTAIEMSVEMDEGIKPIYNVVAKVPGTGDQVVSTEWAEDNAAMLSGKAVAYLNVDAAVTGSMFGASGVPSMRDVLREVAAAVPEPKKGGTVGDAWEHQQKATWARSAPIVLDAKDAAFDLQLGRLGSGSDYTVFLDHLGIPATDMGFGGPHGVYHAVYDNFYCLSHFGDPEFLYHQAAARVLGLLAMRMATADVVPLRFTGYGPALRDDLDAIRTDVIRAARTATGVPFQPDFAPLVKALAELDAAGRAGDAASFERMSTSLNLVERAFLDKDGLPGRSWFKHLLIGPGLTTGYAPWPFPALREAVEKKDAPMFDRESRRIQAVLAAGTAMLRDVAAH